MLQEHDGVLPSRPQYATNGLGLSDDSITQAVSNSKLYFILPSNAKYSIKFGIMLMRRLKHASRINIIITVPQTITIDEHGSVVPSLRCATTVADASYRSIQLVLYIEAVLTHENRNIEIIQHMFDSQL